MDPDVYEDRLDEAVRDKMDALSHNPKLAVRLGDLMDRLGILDEPGNLTWTDLVELVCDLMWGFARLYVDWIGRKWGTDCYHVGLLEVDKNGDLCLKCGGSKWLKLTNTASNDEFAEIVSTITRGEFNGETGSFF